MLVAKNGDTIEGALEGSLEENPEARFGFIHWVCVDPDNQRQGIGPALYKDYEDLLRLRSIPYMVAGIMDANDPSLKMHRRLGFNMDEPYARGDGKKWYHKEILVEET